MKKQSNIHPRSSSVPCAWSRRAKTSMSRNGQRSSPSLARSAAQRRRCGVGYASTNVTLVSIRERRRPNSNGSISWSGKYESCGRATRYCALPVLFSPKRSSTAASSREGLYRRPSGCPRGRADLPGAAGCPVSLLAPCRPLSQSGIEKRTLSE